LGLVFHRHKSDKGVTFHRWDQGGPGDDVIIFVNLRNTPYRPYTIGFPYPGNWYVRFNSHATVYSPDYGPWPGYDTTAAFGSCQGMPCKGNRTRC
jgi:1,4-alpha-glucan branching enzyme